MSSVKHVLYPVLLRLAQLQNASCDRLAIQDSIERLPEHVGPKLQLRLLAKNLNLPAPTWLKAPDPANTPVLLYSADGDWGLLRGVNAQQQWVTEWWDIEGQSWVEAAKASLGGYRFAALSMSRPFQAANSRVYRMIRAEVLSHKRLLIEGALSGVIINTVALATSFYTMQVYDRVVPIGGMQTLLVLTLGVCFAILYELFTKHVRTGIYNRLIDKVDQRLARAVYVRFLNVRLDQMPASVGGLASQMRGYETVRNVLTTITSRLLIDAPFALLFVLVIAAIAGPLAFIPLGFFVLCLTIGWYFKARIDELAGRATAAVNYKTGLLVESVEGAESIKSGQGGWRMLSRWMSTTDESRSYETQMRNVSEHSQHLSASFQQFSYIALVASGALLVSRGELSMGGLIACSILSGRILSPLAGIPALLVQWGHAKAALKGLDAIWALEDDHAGQDQPIILEKINGNYRFEGVAIAYGEHPALRIADLVIRPGEKIGVLGPVGAGKTTLLRLLSGMYKPQSGRIHLDSVDLAHISKPVLAEHIGFVQQEARLFAGTLRENLTLGLLDPGDEAILNAARQTGLLESVIAPHPKGLQREIYEGGTGLSGGQRQLVNLTRAFLRSPTIWLLDEPTASMDRNLETQVMRALKRAIQPEHTLILVTHKSEMLSMVNRLIVIANNQVVVDGARDEVLKTLQQTKPKTKPLAREGSR